jgi:protein required for attachment to host cells
MDKNTWVLVANGKKARIFEVEKFGKLKEISSLVHPRSTLTNEELTRDSLGRKKDFFRKTPSTYEPNTMPKEKEEHTFAKEVAGYMDKSKNTNQFLRLFLMADPHFLGLLRKSLGKNTLSAIEGEVSKDLTELPPDEIWTHMPVVN